MSGSYVRGDSVSVAMVVDDANALTGESPCWDPRSRTLWWIDIQGQRLLGFRPESGEKTVRNLPLMPGFVVNRGAGGLLVGLEDGLYPFDQETGLGSRVVAMGDDDDRIRLNDGKPDAQGRLWFGSMDKSGGGNRIGGLHRLDIDGKISTIRSNVAIPNAIAFSPDGGSFYFADSPTGIIEAFDYDARSGDIGGRREFAVYTSPETPDGACVDQEGGVWVAVVRGARVERRLPDGHLDLVIPLPVTRPTMPMLGGVNGSTLFVTSQRRFLGSEDLVAEPAAGDLLAIDVGFFAAPCAFVLI
jgi:sugar lactone lactonase YvrE